MIEKSITKWLFNSGWYYLLCFLYSIYAVMVWALEGYGLYYLLEDVFSYIAGLTLWFVLLRFIYLRGYKRKEKEIREE